MSNKIVLSDTPEIRAAFGKWAEHLKKIDRYSVPSGKAQFLDDMLKYVEMTAFVTKEERYVRARIHEHDQEQMFELSDMGAPPAEKTRAGRISPEGISCLYLADSAKTAIAEVRPWRGAKLSVATIRVEHGLRLADLRPNEGFRHTIPSSNAAAYEVIRYLVMLVSFSRPVGQENTIEYVPSQYLSSLLKQRQFDGIIYPSLLHATGYNIAIFDPQKATVVSRECYVVKNLTYDVRKLLKAGKNAAVREGNGV